MPMFSSKSSTEQSERASGTRFLTATTAALAFVAALVVPANGQAVERVELGVLECTVDGGTGFIFGSTKDLRCTFNPADDMRAAEPYFGVISRFGIDIGSTSQGTIAWAVLAPTTDMWAPGALAGNYVGIGGEATAGVGLGANALLGGSNETFALQPLSVSTQVGLNFALGVSELELRAIVD
jgi:hypothetical protein